ncbi:MAG: hypothetical protein AB8G26_00560 [Ilumatobacter sp.]
MTIIQIPHTPLVTSQAQRHRKHRSADRRRSSDRVNALRRFFAGWSHRPSDEAMSGLAARDRIGERH